MFAGSPVKRIGRDRLVRNALIAAGNSGDAKLAIVVEALLGDGSPVVRGAAVWALVQLAPSRAAVLAGERVALEPNEEVRAEWLAAVPEPA